VQVRYIVYNESLWRVSAQAFNAVVPAGLPALAAAAAAGEDTRASWEALADAFEAILLGAKFLASSQPHSSSIALGSEAVSINPMDPATVGGSDKGQRVASGSHAAAAAQPAVEGGVVAPTPLNPQQARQDAELEVAVLDCLTDMVLMQCGAAPAETKQRLIATVDTGAARPQALNIPQVCSEGATCKLCLIEWIGLGGFLRGCRNHGLFE